MAQFQESKSCKLRNMRVILCVIVSMVVFSPYLLIFNESDSFLPNLGGFIYCLILYMVRDTKVAKILSNWVQIANKDIERWMTK